MNKMNKVALGLAVLGITSMAHAVDFDPATATAGFSTAVTTASAIVGGLIALGAGILVYKKVRGYFSTAK